MNSPRPTANSVDNQEYRGILPFYAQTDALSRRALGSSNASCSAHAQ